MIKWIGDEADEDKKEVIHGVVLSDGPYQDRIIEMYVGHGYSSCFRILLDSGWHVVQHSKSLDTGDTAEEKRRESIAAIKAEAEALFSA